MTKDEIRAWLLNYAWVGTAEQQTAECIMAQDGWRHLSAQTEHFAGMAESPGPEAYAEAHEFALSGLYECHDAPHLPTCPDAPKCLDGPDGCSGTVEYRMALSGTGQPFPRCDGHWRQRLDVQDGINARYGHPDSASPPAGFDPSYAGESWDED